MHEELKQSSFKTMISHLLDVRPVVATAVTGLQITANASVWTQAIHGVAGVIVVLVSIPTSIFILLYWGMKFRTEWLNRHLNVKKTKKHYYDE